MGKSSYVDENFNILDGEAARDAVRRNSDARYLTEDRGVVKIPLDRWETAQKYEQKGWMEKWADADSDRNHEHAHEFDAYKPLSGMVFEHAIELGCGPFTNLRFIARMAAIRRCTLLDPLIESYLGHRKCAYTRSCLRARGELESRLESRRVPRWLSRLATPTVRRLFCRRLPIAELIAKPIEQMPTEGRRYDLIVLINVLEHCYDAELIFDQIRKIAGPKAVFIFHDKYHSHEQIGQVLKETLYDAGHPLFVDRKVIDAFLDGSCDCLYRKLVRKPHPVLSFCDGLYFIGRFR
jgi:SAM-dependent methyltransferase